RTSLLWCGHAACRVRIADHLSTMVCNADPTMSEPHETSDVPPAVNRASRRIGALLAPLTAAAICLLAAVLALAALGYSPNQVLTVVWTKVLFRPDLHRRLISWANILQYATPLLLTGLAVTLAFRASVWNIGGQGQY